MAIRLRAVTKISRVNPAVRANPVVQDGLALPGFQKVLKTIDYAFLFSFHSFYTDYRLSDFLLVPT